MNDTINLRDLVFIHPGLGRIEFTGRMAKSPGPPFFLQVIQLRPDCSDERRMTVIPMSDMDRLVIAPEYL